MTAEQQHLRPRYGRLGMLLVSVSVTVVALLGGVGLLPSTSPSAAAPTRSSSHEAAGAVRLSALDVADSHASARSTDSASAARSPDSVETVRVQEALPRESGEGRRVVFSEARQRVWLVDRHDRVRSTYLVSGSRYDNLDPGSYQVYSRSEQAWAFDGSGQMRLFVRFAQGDSGAAIGFHTIPESGGLPAQTLGQLGTPQSHGCIRQRDRDARALWRFAPIGTTVVVV